MNIDSRTIDDIVAGVLKQLGTATVVRAEKADEQAPFLDATVVSEDVLREHAAGTEQLLLREDAIITPSGRDWLRRNHISWERRPSHKTTSHNASDWRLILIGKPDLAEKVVEAGRSLEWLTERVNDTDAATKLAISLVTQGEVVGAIVVSDQPERIACRANRNPEIRAAAAHSVEDVKRIRQQLGANLIAIASSERSYFELRNVFRAISAGGPPAEPADWSLPHS
ncbi:MAG TPA: RpiB/LacA/LacB family sugar-phosphate isomerase [Planctomycetaceae bacterium]|nr:RpiB/LacA/LacB family sugar-phosphate isomerase [Planctomycetaceae bacterium]